jgi:hypothetical protein
MIFFGDWRRQVTARTTFTRSKGGKLEKENKMKKSETIGKLAGALALAQAEMPDVKKNAQNPFFKNKYADLGAVIETSRPVLAKNGLSISQFPTSEGDKIGVTSILMHTSGEYIEDTICISASDSKGVSIAQSAGIVISYLRRYGWASILGMYADEDTDGATKQAEKGKPSQSEPAPKVTNEIITSAEWDNFTALVKKADDAGIKHPAYDRAKMDAGRLNGVSNWIKQELEKAGK